MFPSGLANMTVIYRPICTTCGYEGPATTPSELWVWVTDAREDAQRQRGEHPHIVLHPMKPCVLEEFGLSFSWAAWGGHLVQVRKLVCLDCGRLFDYRWLTAGGVPVGCAGCLGITFLAGIIAGVATLAVDNAFIGLGVGLTSAALLLAICELGASPLVRLWYASRARAIATERSCPDCLRTGLPVDRVVEPVPCPQCGNHSLEFVNHRTPS